SALIDASQQKIEADAAAIHNVARSYARLSVTRRRRAQQKSLASLRHAIAHQRGDFAKLNSAVSAQPATTPAAINARNLTLQTIRLIQAALKDLDDGLKAHKASKARKLIGDSRKLLDQSVQSGVNAKAALRQP